MDTYDFVPTRPILRLGDEPEDLARGRLLLETHAGNPILRFPRKGHAIEPTALDGVDAEWALRSVEAPPGREWLLDLAAAGRPETALIRDLRVLLSSARRSAAHDLPYAFGALAGQPAEVRKDPRLRAFREECARAVGAALRTRPRFAWRVALISLCSAEAVEDIVAARWRRKLDRHLVLAANHGYQGGVVTYAFRSGPEGLRILRAALPEGAPPPRLNAKEDAGRGSLPAVQHAELLARLRFGRTNELAG